MERTIDMDERIRRAEELYNRRKMQGGVRVSTSNVNNSSRTSLGLFKKMIMKIVLCAVIYAVFYILKNSGVIFSKDIINQTKKIMSYDINFNQVYSQTIKIFNDNIKNRTKKNVENGEKQEKTPETEDVIQSEENKIIENNTIGETMGVGGTENKETPINIVENSPAQVTVIQKTQMEIDAENVKSRLKFIKPLQGIITSRFGPRQPTEIISADHKGIDIGETTGTSICSAIDGTVIEVSNYGDYGKHLYIENGDVVVLYAHCSKINVKTGQYIKQGQEIAKVGSTGRATGPHLHFEIRREGRAIDPEYILDF